MGKIKFRHLYFAFAAVSWVIRGLKQTILSCCFGLLHLTLFEHFLWCTDQVHCWWCVDYWLPCGQPYTIMAMRTTSSSSLEWKILGTTDVIMCTMDWQVSQFKFFPFIYIFADKSILGTTCFFSCMLGKLHYHLLCPFVKERSPFSWFLSFSLFPLLHLECLSFRVAGFRFVTSNRC